MRDTYIYVSQREKTFLKIFRPDAFFSYLCKTIYVYRVFLTGGDGGVSPPAKIPPLRKIPLLISPLPPYQVFIPSPPKVNSTQQKNKNVIFSCSHCSCTIFVLISYSFETQIVLILILIDV